MNWLAENWYVAWALLCAAAIFGGAVHFRRNPEASGAKAFFWLFPRLNPGYKISSELTPLAIVLWCIGILIVLLAIIFVPGFA